MKDIKSLKMDYEAERNWKKEGGVATGYDGQHVAPANAAGAQTKVLSL